MTFESSIDKISMPIRAVLWLSDLGLHISQTECIMSASSVNTALQNGGNSNQSALFTFKERDYCVSVVAQQEQTCGTFLKFVYLSVVK